MNQERIAKIRSILETAFQPTHLSIEDQSHLHRGHAGAQDGRGHFAIEIASTAFEGKSPVAQHRMIYEALGDLMNTDIHALIIKIKSSMS